MTTEVQQETAESIGESRMITFVTPIRFGCTWLVRLLFAVTRPFPWILGIGALKVVHFTQWSVVTAIPYNGPGQLRERPARAMLLWSSLYNGLVDPYVEVFVARVSRQIGWTWGTSYDFPGTKSVGKLIGYISAAAWPGSYAYSAYPDATVRTVESAMRVDAEHRYLLELLERRPTDEEFAAAYEQFLCRRQGDL